MTITKGLVELPTWKDGLPPTSVYRVGSAPAPVYATRYMTREHTYGVDKGKDPHCDFCSHQVERIFNVTEETHHVEIPENRGGVVWACVACWSRLAKDPAEDED